MDILDLVLNLAVLVAANVALGYLIDYRRKGWWQAILQGALFGLVIVIGLVDSMELQEGVIYDARSVVASLCGLLFGPVAALVAALIGGTYRYMLGGAGMPTGVLMIVVSAGIGAVCHGRRGHEREEFSVSFLLYFGLLVQLLMLALLLVLPGNLLYEVFRRVFWTVLVAYPLATVLVGRFLSDQRSRQRHLAELHESREAWRTTFYGIGDAVIATDELGRIRQMNEQAELLTGWSEEQATGRQLDDVLHVIDEATGDAAASPAQQVLTLGVRCEMSERTVLVARDGTRRPVADSASPIRDSDGRITGVVLVFRDQTAKRQAQQQLEERERQYRMLFERAPLGIFTTDSEGHLLTCNPSLVRTLGLDEGKDGMRSFLGDTFPAKLDREARGRFFDEVLEKGVVEDHRVEVKTVDGRRLVMNASARRGDLREDGTFPIEGFVVDITQRDLAERALADSERSYRTLLDSTTDMVTLKDAQFRYLLANRAMCRFAGKSEAEIEGQSDSEVLPPELADYSRRSDEQALAKGELVVSRTLFDGRTYETRTFPVHLPDGVLGVGSFVRDITDFVRADEEREHLQEQLQQSRKMETVGRLAGGVAHDFNNHLTAITGYAQLCRETVPADTDLADWLGEIVKGTNRSADLTRQLLTFARKQTIAPRVVDLNVAIEGTLGMLRRLIGEGIALLWEPGEGGCTVRIDVSQLDQVLSNLVVNARDAISGVGSVTICTEVVALDRAFCAAHPDLHEGPHVLLSVADDGCGMDRDTLAHVFEPFFTTKDVGQGTGLGLATVYGVVSQNGGGIHVESEPGQGTVFRIYLPQQSEIPEPALPTVGRHGDLPEGNETILVVEDESTVLRFATLTLRRLGYTVLAADGPEMALELARDGETEVHLLLTDVVMPKMNGRELRDRLLASRPDMRCLFISGYTAEIIARHGIVEEGLHLLEKPFSRYDLAVAIRQALDE